MKIKDLTLTILIFYAVNVTVFSNDCIQTDIKTSLDPISCSINEEDFGDCRCYSEKYKSLVNEKDRLPLVNKGMGEIALKYLEESFLDIANSAKELSSMDFKLMDGEVAHSCTMDRLGEKIKESCELNNEQVNKRISSYFGGNSGINDLAGFTKRIVNIFEKQIPKTFSQSTENSCLSEGELQTIKNRNKFHKQLKEYNKDFKNLSVMIDGYNGKGKLWDRLKGSEYKNFISSNPLLKLIFEHEELSKEFINEGAPLDELSIKKFITRESNVKLVKESVVSMCDNTLNNITSLICKSPNSSMISNPRFNEVYLGYRPESFINGYNERTANKLARRLKKTPEFLLERHISFCQSKLQKFKCENNEKSCIEADKILDNLTYSMSNEIFMTSGGKDNKDYSLNEGFCPIYFCSNLKEVIEKGPSVCKKTNKPNKEAILKFFANNKQLPCPSILAKGPYNCPSDGSLTDDFKEFMRVMDEKMGIEKPVVADSGSQNTQRSHSSPESTSTVSEKSEPKEESKSMFTRFVDNFMGGEFGKLLGAKDKDKDEIRIEDLAKMKPKILSGSSASASESSLAQNPSDSQTSDSGGSDSSNTAEGSAKSSGQVAGGVQGAGSGAGLQNGMAPQNGRFFPGNQPPTSPYPYPNSPATQGGTASTNSNVSPMKNKPLSAQDYFNDMQRLDEMERELKSKQSEFADLKTEKGAASKKRALQDEIAKLSKQIEEEKAKKSNTAVRNSNSPYRNSVASNSPSSRSQPTNFSGGGSYGTKPSSGNYPADNALSPDPVAGAAQSSMGSNKSGRTPASVASTNGATGGTGGRGSNSSSNNLPFNESGPALTEAQAEQKSPKVIVIKANEIDLSLQKIDIAAAIRKNNVKLEKGAPFKIDFDGQGMIEFMPQYENNVFTGYYVPQPANSDLILFLKEAPYWRKVRVNGLNNEMKRQRR